MGVHPECSLSQEKSAAAQGMGKARHACACAWTGRQRRGSRLLTHRAPQRPALWPARAAGVTPLQSLRGQARSKAGPGRQLRLARPRPQAPQNSHNPHPPAGWASVDQSTSEPLPAPACQIAVWLKINPEGHPPPQGPLPRHRLLPRALQSHGGRSGIIGTPAQQLPALEEDCLLGPSRTSKAQSTILGWSEAIAKHAWTTRSRGGWRPWLRGCSAGAFRCPWCWPHSR